MIPFRDSEATRRLTPANTVLIVANLAVFALEIDLGRKAVPMLAPYAMVPARLTHLHFAHPVSILATLATLVTSSFLHAGIFHIAGNMLYLFIFGPAVEQRLGWRRYTAFYFAAAIAAGFAMVAMGPDSRVPVIGASGAIAGVLGAYVVSVPLTRSLPAILVVGIWAATQFATGFDTLGPQAPASGGTAYFAHIGGFSMGVLLAVLFKLHAIRIST